MSTYAVRIVHPKAPRILDYTLNARTGPAARKESALLLAGRGDGAILTLSRVNANGIHIPVVMGERRGKSNRWRAPAF